MPMSDADFSAAMRDMCSVQWFPESIYVNQFGYMEQVQFATYQRYLSNDAEYGGNREACIAGMAPEGNPIFFRNWPQPARRDLNWVLYDDGLGGYVTFGGMQLLRNTVTQQVAIAQPKGFLQNQPDWYYSSIIENGLIPTGSQLQIINLPLDFNPLGGLASLALLQNALRAQAGPAYATLAVRTLPILNPPTGMINNGLPGIIQPPNGPPGVGGGQVGGIPFQRRLTWEQFCDLINVPYSITRAQLISHPTGLRFYNECLANGMIRQMDVPHRMWYLPNVQIIPPAAPGSAFYNSEPGGFLRDWITNAIQLPEPAPIPGPYIRLLIVDGSLYGLTGDLRLVRLGRSVAAPLATPTYTQMPTNEQIIALPSNFTTPVLQGPSIPGNGQITPPPAGPPPNPPPASLPGSGIGGPGGIRPPDPQELIRTPTTTPGPGDALIDTPPNGGPINNGSFNPPNGNLIAPWSGQQPQVRWIETLIRYGYTPISGQPIVPAGVIQAPLRAGVSADITAGRLSWTDIPPDVRQFLQQSPLGSTVGINLLPGTTSVPWLTNPANNPAMNLIYGPNTGNPLYATWSSYWQAFFNPNTNPRLPAPMPTGTPPPSPPPRLVSPPDWQQRVIDRLRLMPPEPPAIPVVPGGPPIVLGPPGTTPIVPPLPGTQPPPATPAPTGGALVPAVPEPPITVILPPANPPAGGGPLVPIGWQSGPPPATPPPGWVVIRNPATGQWRWTPIAPPVNAIVVPNPGGQPIAIPEPPIIRIQPRPTVNPPRPGGGQLGGTIISLIPGINDEIGRWYPGFDIRPGTPLVIGDNMSFSQYISNAIWNWNGPYLIDDTPGNVVLFFIRQNNMENERKLQFENDHPIAMPPCATAAELSRNIQLRDAQQYNTVIVTPTNMARARTYLENLLPTIRSTDLLAYMYDFNSRPIAFQVTGELDIYTNPHANKDSQICLEMQFAAVNTPEAFANLIIQPNTPEKQMAQGWLLSHPGCLNQCLDAMLNGGTAFQLQQRQRILVAMANGTLQAGGTLIIPLIGQAIGGVNYLINPGGGQQSILPLGEPAVAPGVGSSGAIYIIPENQQNPQWAYYQSVISGAPPINRQMFLQNTRAMNLAAAAQVQVSNPTLGQQLLNFINQYQPANVQTPSVTTTSSVPGISTQQNTSCNCPTEVAVTQAVTAAEISGKFPGSGAYQAVAFVAMNGGGGGGGGVGGVPVVIGAGISWATAAIVVSSVSNSPMPTCMTCSSLNGTYTFPTGSGNASAWNWVSNSFSFCSTTVEWRLSWIANNSYTLILFDVTNSLILVTYTGTSLTSGVISGPNTVNLSYQTGGGACIYPMSVTLNFS